MTKVSLSPISPPTNPPPPSSITQGLVAAQIAGFLPAGAYPVQSGPGTGVRPSNRFTALWRTALAAASSRTVNMFFWGASVGGGSSMLSSNWNTKGCSQLLVKGLQAIYGDGGSGWVSVANVNGITPQIASSISASGAGGNAVGGWDSGPLLSTVLQIGPNLYGIYPHVAASGVTLTDTNVRGTTIDIYWVATTSAGTTFQYSIDGGAQVQVNATVGALANSGIGVTTISGLSAGTHTLVITANGGTPQMIGWCGRNATGILPFYISHPGKPLMESGFTANNGGTTRTAGYFASGNGVAQGGGNLWPAGPPDAAILSDMGVNDATGNYIFNIQPYPNAGSSGSPTPTQFAGALETFLSGFTTANPNVAIALHILNLGNVGDPGSRSITCSTTINTNTLTVTVGSFSLLDIGSVISGNANIPTGTTIIGVNPPNNTATLSANATATAAGVATTISDPAAMYGSYATALKQVGDSYGAQILDFWNLADNSWANWNNFGLWGNPASLGNAGTDPVHPSDKGHAYMASIMLPALALL